MSEEVDITASGRALVKGVCQRAGVEPSTVRSVTVTPKTVEAELYCLNEQGSKFIGNGGKVATEFRTWEFSYA